MGSRASRALVAARRPYTFDSPGGGGGLFGFGGGGGGPGFSAPWPRSMVNTGLCVCPQGERMVVERFGKLNDIKGPGLFFAIPLVDRIA